MPECTGIDGALPVGATDLSALAASMSPSDCEIPSETSLSEDETSVRTVLPALSTFVTLIPSAVMAEIRPAGEECRA